jgi:hypothetical protein
MDATHEAWHDEFVFEFPILIVMPWLVRGIHGVC